MVTVPVLKQLSGSAVESAGVSKTSQNTAVVLQWTLSRAQKLRGRHLFATLDEVLHALKVKIDLSV